MQDSIRDRVEGPVTEALILDDDAAGSEDLRRTLGALGYDAYVITDANAALDTLQVSDAPMAVFFNVEAHGSTLDGHSYAFLIGALLGDPSLAHRHIYAVISSTADDVEWALGKALDRLGAPVFRKPCAATALATYLALARGRPIPPTAPEIATI
jgi:CheY-like chemotaxis protein